MLRVHHLASLGLVLALGCAGGDLSTSRSGSDGGGDLGDASLADASLGPPDGGLEAGSIPTADAGDLDASDPSETTGYRFGPSAAFGVTEGETDQSVASCYDGVDNDGVGGLDCGDPSCQALGACCAGSGLCCEAPSPLIPAADFTSCAGMPLADCLLSLGLEATPFGSVTPFLDAAGLAPGGELSSDGGLLFDAPLDLGVERVRLEATLDAGVSCGDACLEAVGVGVTTQTDLGAAPRVRPAVALLSSNARQEVRLIVDDEVVASWPLLSSRERWILELQPRGQLEVWRGAEPLLTTAFRPTSFARIVAYGRSRNPSLELPGARLSGLEASSSVCDMPTAWRHRSPLRLSYASNPDAALPQPGASSFIADPEGGVLWAFESQGALYTAHRDPLDPLLFHLDGSPARPALGSSELSFATSLGDPELLVTGGEVELFFSVERPGGGFAIAQAQRMAGGGWAVADRPTLEPEPFDLLGLSEPTLVRHSEALLLIARADTPLGSSLRVFHRPNASTSFGALRSSDLGAVATQVDLGAGEIGDPELMIHGSTYHLYLSARRGTRATIALLASDEMLSWRLVERAALEPLGVGFDAIAARAPALLPASDGSAELELFYLGSDGIRELAGVTHRLAPNAGAFR